MAFRPALFQSKMTRDQLLTVVRRIVSFDVASEEEYQQLVAQFTSNVPHPAAADLIFHTDPQPSPEEIVDRALAYGGIPLGPGPGSTQ